jgi:predicted DCC family thiol-disulfide oxidoreductase YuxK
MSNLQTGNPPGTPTSVDVRTDLTESYPPNSTLLFPRPDRYAEFIPLAAATLCFLVSRDNCYYDGQCGLCQRSRRILSALDVFGQLHFVDLTAIPESELPVSLDAALRGMPMRTHAGRVLIGFPAVRRALSRTIAGPIGWCLYIPGVSHVGAAVYQRIALNRARSGCPVPKTPQGGR